MASKNSVTKKASRKAPKTEILIKLSRRARREVEKLLKRSEAGTITHAELNAGLKEAEAPLKQMLDYITKTLEDMLRLQKRTRGTTIDLKDLNAKLKAVRKSVYRLLNHSGPGDLHHRHH
jgi:hypothetical protein